MEKQNYRKKESRPLIEKAAPFKYLNIECSGFTLLRLLILFLL